jgi:hypothetical protein
MGNENNNEFSKITKKNSSKNINKNFAKNSQTKDDFQKQNKESNDFQTKKPTRFATVFQWDGGGTNVYLTGSFCDWQQFFEMEKCEDKKNEKSNKFFLTLFLPKGAYQYKFKIDDQWKCNSNFPTCSDKNGNVNNIVDITKQIKDILQLRISNKYRKFSKDKDYNQNIYNEVIAESDWLEKLFDMNYLEAFKLYYNNCQPLTTFEFEGKVVNFSQETESFICLYNKAETKEKKLRLKFIAEGYYLQLGYQTIFENELSTEL